MKLYHVTFCADKILDGGFRDSTDNYMTDQEFTGVWFSNRPLDSNEGATGDTVLMLEIPVKIIKDHEWIEVQKPYREWLIPAELANQYGPPVIVYQYE